MSSPTRTRRVAAALAALLLVASFPSATAAATRPITFRLLLGGSCIAGVASDDATLELTWRDAAGDLKAKATVSATPWGSWSHCFGDAADTGSDPNYRLEVGDRLKATVGSVTRRLTIPELTIHVDRANDRSRGKAPAGSRLRLVYSNGLFSDFEQWAKVEAGADGRWSFDHNVMGGFYASVTWRGPEKDRISLSDFAPYVVVTLGKSRFSGVKRPGRTVEITIEDGTTMELKATGVAGGDSWDLVGHFKDEAGDRVAIAAGDHLSAPAIASDADWMVPRVQGRANASTDVFKGRCFDTGSSGDFFEIRVRSPGGRLRGYALGSTDGQEPFEVDFSHGPPNPFFHPTDIRVGDRISVRCLQETGDWVVRDLVVT